MIAGEQVAIKARAGSARDGRRQFLRLISFGPVGKLI
jgi:hypothetical protein